MSVRKTECALRFPCECVSAESGYSDPWAAIAQRKLLPNGTKERVLNAVSRQPKTISHLAAELGLSQPTIHTHVNEMLKSELLRETAARRKQHPAENYYEPAFPVIKSADRAVLDAVCEAVAKEVASLFEARQAQLRLALGKTALPGRGWEFDDVAQYCYASVQRGARELLEKRGLLSPRARHANGAEWIFWGEEADSKPLR